MSIQRIIANNSNRISDAVITASSSTSSPFITKTGVNRQGNGNMGLSGSYTGNEDAIFDVMITSTSGGAATTSTPMFSGTGSGSLANLQAGNLPMQDVTITLANMGISTQKAMLDFYGVVLQAKVNGAAGNGISVSVTDHTVKTLSAMSLFEDIAYNQEVLKGAQNDFQSLTLTAKGEMDPNSIRICFGDDPQIFRQYKKPVKSDFEYNLVPNAPRMIKGGTPIYTVTGGYTVTVTSGSTVETYPNIITLYDLLAAFQLSSNLIEVLGVVTKDMQPAGMATIDLTLRTSAYNLPITKSNANMKDLVLSGIPSNAPTEKVTVTCTNNDTLGSESWRVAGSVSGDLGYLSTGVGATLKGYSLRVPTWLPPAQTAVTGGVSLRSTYWAQRSDTAPIPDICVSGKLGIAASSKSITAVWTKYTKTEDCNCEKASVTGIYNYEALGLPTVSGSDDMIDTAYKTRLIELYDFRKNFIEHNSYPFSPGGHAEIPYAPAKPEQLYQPAQPYVPSVPYSPYTPEVLAQDAWSETRAAIQVRLYRKGAASVFSKVIPLEPFTTRSYAVCAAAVYPGLAPGSTTAANLKEIAENYIDPNDTDLKNGLLALSFLEHNLGRAWYSVAWNVTCEETPPTSGTYVLSGSITVTIDLGASDSSGTEVYAYWSQFGWGTQYGTRPSYVAGSYPITFATLTEAQNFAGDLLTGILSFGWNSAQYGYDISYPAQIEQHPAVTFQAAKAEVLAVPAIPYRAEVPYRAAIPEQPYVPATVGFRSIPHLSKEDIAWMQPFIDLLLNSLAIFYTIPAALAEWDDLKDEILAELTLIDQKKWSDVNQMMQMNKIDTLSNEEYSNPTGEWNSTKTFYQNFDSSYIERYKAKLDSIYLTAGMIPGKDNLSTGGGTGLWTGRAADFWELSDGYACAYTNEIYHSTKFNNSKEPYQTKEFALAIAMKCPNTLKYGDTLTIDISGGVAIIKTYEVNNSYEIPVVASAPSVLVGGVNGTDTVTWNVRGMTSGMLSDYHVVANAPQRYHDSSSGLQFDMTLGGIPFALGDQFRFSVESGQFKWRKGEGAWSANTSLANGALSDGLTAIFPPGANPSYVVGDTFTFSAKQPYSPLNVTKPNNTNSWTFIAGASITATLPSSKTATSLCIVHTLPAGTHITFGASIFGVTSLITGGTGIEYLEGDAATFSAITLTISAAGSISYMYLGIPLTTELAPDSIELRRQWEVLHGAKSNFGGVYVGQGYSGQIAWKDFISKDEFDAHITMIDHVKRNGDEPIIFVPHHLHPEEAFMCRIEADQVDMIDLLQYHPNDQSSRIMSLTIPFSPLTK